MKYLYFHFLALMLICSCSNEVEIQGCITDSSSSSTRSFEEALSIAESSIKMIYEDYVSSRSNAVNRHVDESRSLILPNLQSRSVNNQNDTLLYVFNFADEMGFAVVSAKKNTEGLIAVTENGDYEKSLSENKAFASYMSQAIDYISNAVATTSFDPFESCDTIYSHRGPYLSVKWGQNYPAGVFFPNATAGCGNVAILQILSYFSYPNTITLTYPNADSASIVLDWDEMRAHETTTYYQDYCTTGFSNSHSDIAHLCRQIAEISSSTFLPVTVNYSYSLNNYVPLATGKTSTNVDSLVHTFSTLGYTATEPQNYTSQCTFSPLTRNNLIFMSGVTSSNEGHGWVADGYKKYTIRSVSHATEPSTITTRSIYYNHFNWGWNGIDNVYFLDDVFTPSRGSEYDGVSDEDNRNYSQETLYLIVNH